MKTFLISSIAALSLASPALADIQMQGNSSSCSNQCPPDRIEFGQDAWGQQVTLFPRTVKRVSEFSADFSFALNNRSLGAQMRCQGDRLRLFTLHDKRWIELESAAMFRMTGTACKLGGF